MCGIIGSRGPFSKEAISKAAKSIKHRGPDAFGIYAHTDVVLAHYRLAILDLSENGAQPYHFENLTVVFNGEIYNYREIRQLLIQAGYSFSSDSDTEVLIKSFHKWGCKAVERFIGMFAFCLYDRNDDSLYLFRDRLGVKPLYYSTEGGLIFGSELRTLLPFLSTRTLDAESLNEYFRLGYISKHRTIYNSAKKLLPGHYLHYKNGAATLHRYWSVQEAATESKYQSEADWKEEIESLMVDAFRLRMVSDVPVGVFLSGGVDSSLVTAILQKHYGNIHTFTIGFDDERYNEAPYASQISAFLGTNHTEFRLDVNDAYEVLTHFYDVYDEPFADSSGIPSTVVSGLAAKAGIKVVLSADGGDELFGGYSHYEKTFRLYNKMNGIPRLLKQLAGLGTKGIAKSRIFKYAYRGNLEHRFAAANELLETKTLGSFYQGYIANQATDEVRRLIVPKVQEVRPSLLTETMAGLMLHDIETYLPDDLLVKMDRATMYNSIEGREPFLDHRLVELASKLPGDMKLRNGETKWILKEILAKYIPREYFIRPKKGFSIPIFRWFSGPLDKMFDEYLAPDRIKACGVLQLSEVQNEQRKYRWNKERGKEYNIEKMWRLLSFMMWWEKWNNVS